MAFDTHRNLAISAVATPPSPATSGTSLVLSSGHGATRVPASLPANAVICPTGTSPSPDNAEIIRVTGRSTDTLTIVRAQEGSTARTVIAGDLIYFPTTAKTFTDIETSIPFLSSLLYASPGTGTVTTALQQWVDDAATQGRVALLMPGEWRANLTLPHGLIMQGVTAGGYETEVSDTYQSRLVAPSGSTSPVITIAAGTKHQQIRAIHMDGALSSSGGLISIANAGSTQEAQVIIDNCYLSYAKGDAITVGTNRRAVKIRNTSIILGDSDGVVVNGSDTTVIQCIIGDCTGTGISISESVCRIIANEIYGCGNGIIVNSSIQGFMISANGIDRNENHGVYVSSGCIGTIIGNDLHQNSLASSGGYNHITLASGIVHVSVTGNTFQDDGVTAMAALGIGVQGGLADRLKVELFGNSGSATAYIDGLCNINPAYHLGNGEFSPVDVEMTACNYDPLHISATSTPLGVDGTLYIQRVRVDQSTTITYLNLLVITAGATLTSGQCKAALYSGAGDLLGTTSDQSTAWTTTGLKQCALTTPYEITEPGHYYVGMWANGTTRPAMGRAPVGGAEGANGFLGSTDYRWASADTGLTTTAPATLGTMTAVPQSGATYWAGLS